MTTRLMMMATCVLLLTGCEDGRITLSVADAPVDDVSAVVVQFSRVTLVNDDDTRETIQLSPPVQVDLLEFTGGLSREILSSRPLRTGSYRRVELRIDGSATTTESYVDLIDGARLPLFVPDSARAALSVAFDFEVEEKRETRLTADFDLRSSLRDGADAFELHPKLRIIADGEAGVVSGEVSRSLITDGCSPAVYVYSGSGVTPDDIGGSGEQPISSARVGPDSAGTLRYAVGFLEAGAHTLALTCQASADDPTRDDSITFVRTRNVTVRAGRTVSAPIN